MRMIDSSGSRRISRTACTQATRRSASICLPTVALGPGMDSVRRGPTSWHGRKPGGSALSSGTPRPKECSPPHTSTNWSRELRTASHRVAARRATEPVSRLASCAVDADAIGRVTIGRAAPCRVCARVLPRAIIASVIIAAVRVHTVPSSRRQAPARGTPSRSVRDTWTTM